MITPNLPRWQKGRIRLVDIMPAHPLAGPPRPGLRVHFGWTDVMLRDGAVELPEWEPCVREGYLEETLDEEGRAGLRIDDAAFATLIPHGTPKPLCLAGYHISFLRNLMGGPWGLRPRHLCLYRTGRMFELCGPHGDASLCGMSRTIMPESADFGYALPITNRILQATVVLSRLLTVARLNMLVSLSCTRMEPPPTDEPFGRMNGWDNCPGGAFIDFD